MAAYFNIFLIVMALLALAVYIALHYFEAGYGYLFNRKYGFPIPNRIGWVLMECPVFIAMTVPSMPAGIVGMGMLFNTLNALMQGGWIFYISPADYYEGWFSKPYFYIGAALFVAGMVINLHSDYIIRHLRKPGDTRHYIPRGGMFRYVSSANYFGELTEWVGFAIASWSWAGAVFACHLLSFQL